MKKLTLLLASVGAAALLVGGTVALNIVTSASPIGVQISPGSIDTDESHRIVLSWGQNTTAPVGNLIPEIETNVGEVLLAAKEGDAATAYSGIFKASITDDASYEGETPLSNYLAVKAYKSVANEYPSAATFTLDKNHKTESRQGAAGDGYKFTVTLSADPEAAYYADLLTQKVTLTLEWTKADSDTDIEDIANVYFAKPSAWEGNDVYVYAYKDGKVLTTYPGLKMTYEYDIEGNLGLYSAAFDRTNYDHFIFNNGSHATDVAASKQFADPEPNPYYDGKTWTTKPVPLTYAYYVRGVIGGENYWSTDAQFLGLKHPVEVEAGEQFKSDELTLQLGDKFKVYKVAGEVWYGSADFEITSEILSEHGNKFEIWFNSNKTESSETPEQTSGWGWWDHGLGVHIVSGE